MNDKLKTKIFMMVILAGVLVLLGLTFVNSAFISAFMLWLSLFVFSICYYIKDNDKKKLLYGLFIVGVLLVIGAIWYMIMRIM